MSDSKHTSIRSFIDVLDNIKTHHLTLPGKKESIQHLKDALEACTHAQLHTMAKVFDLDTTDVSDSRLRLNILDRLQFLIYGHSIQSGNSLVWWALLLVLFYIFSALAGWSEKTAEQHDSRWELTKRFNVATNILLIIVYIFGISLTTKFLIRFTIQLL